MVVVKKGVAALQPLFNDNSWALYLCHEFIHLYSNDFNSYEFDVMFQLIGPFLHPVAVVFVFNSSD